MTAWDTSLLFAHCCGGQLTVAGETETSAIWFPFKWKYWQGLVRVSAPSPASVQKPTGNCLEEFRSPAVASSLATPPAAIQRHGEETLPVRVLSALKDCDLEGVRGKWTHSEPDASLQLFHLFLPEKMVIYLPHSSGWAMNVH